MGNSGPQTTRSLTVTLEIWLGKHCIGVRSKTVFRFMQQDLNLVGLLHKDMGGELIGWPESPFCPISCSVLVLLAFKMTRKSTPCSLLLFISVGLRVCACVCAREKKWIPARTQCGLLSKVETKFHGSSLEEPPEWFPKKKTQRAGRAQIGFSLYRKWASIQCETNEVMWVWYGQLYLNKSLSLRVSFEWLRVNWAYHKVTVAYCHPAALP